MNETKMSDRELDEAVALTVMGWAKGLYTSRPKGNTEMVGYRRPGGPSFDWREVPKFTSDGNAMLSLIEKMRERGWGLMTDTFDESPFYGAAFITMGSRPLVDMQATADTLPRAVAEAAYAALQAEEKQ